MGLRFFRSASIVCLVFAGVLCLSDTARATNYSWSGTETIVESEIKLPDDSPSDTCVHSIQYVDLYPDMLDRRFCAQSSENSVFGVYFKKSAATYYYGPQDKQLYPFVSSICYRYDDCLYIPQHDMLVALENRVNGIVRSLVVYKNFSSRITAHEMPADIQAKNVHYEFNSSSPDLVFAHPTSGYAWPVSSVAASANGEWLVVGFQDRGIGVLNLHTLEMKRVSTTPAFKYGRGYDPRPEMAISDTGANIAIVGMNAGFTVIDVDGVCGDDPLVAWLYGTATLVQKCKTSYPEFSKFTDHFSQANKPKFYDDGGRLSFNVLSYDHTVKGVMLRHPSAQERSIQYIALGDSYTSGEGETDDNYYQQGTNIPLEKCHVSSRSYPYVFAGLIDLAKTRVRNVACSGAVTEDVFSEASHLYAGQKNLQKALGVSDRDYALIRLEAVTSFSPGRDVQLNFVNFYKPSAVTIGVGGNDLELIKIMKACIMPGTCEFAQPGPSRYALARQIQSLYPQLVRLYGEILAGDQGVKLAVVGYADPFGTQDKCSVTLQAMLSSDEREFFRSTISYLNRIMSDAARKVGVQYIDTWQAYGDHALCGESPEKAIRHIVFGDDFGLLKDSRWFNLFGKESFHPTPLGHELLAAEMVRQMPTLKYSACPGGYYVCPNEGAAASGIDAYWLEGVEEGQNIQDIQSVDAAEDAVDIGSPLDIAVPEGVFAPGASVDIELHSDPYTFGSFIADTNGSLQASITLPKTVTAGMHTLHMFGISATGKQLDAFEAVAVNEPIVVAPEVVVENTTSSTVANDDPETTATQLIEEPEVPTTKTVSPGVGFVSSPIYIGSPAPFKPGVLDIQAKIPQDTIDWPWLGAGGGAALAVLVLWYVLRKWTRGR